MKLVSKHDKYWTKHKLTLENNTRTIGERDNVNGIDSIKQKAHIFPVIVIKDWKDNVFLALKKMHNAY